MGQAAFLSRNLSEVSVGFYASVPGRASEIETINFLEIDQHLVFL